MELGVELSEPKPAKTLQEKASNVMLWLSNNRLPYTAANVEKAMKTAGLPVGRIEANGKRVPAPDGKERIWLIVMPDGTATGFIVE